MTSDSLPDRPDSLRSGVPTLAVALGVCLVAAVLGVVWMVSSDTAAAVSVAVSALLAAFPVGLLLSAWLPLRIASGRGAGVGLRVTEPALRAAQRVTTIVLDKSGTVTTGELKVVSVDPVEPDHDRNLRWFAGALEHSSAHPVGRAIAKLAGRGHLANVEQTPGFGISGSVDRHPVRVGRPDWIGLDHAGGDGITVAVEVDARALGHITVDDVVRDDAAASVSRLRALGLSPALVSDATTHNTERVASAAGIEVMHAEVAMEKRARVVTELQETGQVVAYVGSVADNAEALASADLAVTSPAAPGSPAASSSSAPAVSAGGGHATIQLDTLDAGVVANTLSLAHTTASVIRSNRAIGLLTCVVGLVLAGVGILTPLLGLAFGVLAALVVVGNSLRVRAGAPLGKRPEPSE